MYKYHFFLLFFLPLDAPTLHASECLSASATCLPDSTISPASPAHKGWFFLNTIDDDLTVRSFVIRNDRKRQETTHLKPHTKTFVAASDLSDPIIIEGNIGNDNDISYPVQIPPHQIPYHKDDINCELIIIQENEVEKKFKLLNATSSWLICNRTSSINLYSAWYTGNPHKRLTKPKKMILKGECVPFYQDEISNKVLVFSKSADHLPVEADTIQRICLSLSAETLSKHKELIIIGGDTKRILGLDSSNQHFTLINTTNLFLQCALYQYSIAADKRPTYDNIIESTHHLLSPQKRTLISQAVLPRKGGIALVIAKEGVNVIDTLNDEQGTKPVALYDLGSGKKLDGKTLSIDTVLNGGKYSFTITPFDKAMPNILPYIVANIDSTRKLFSPGVFSQIEREIEPIMKSNSNQDDDNNDNNATKPTQALCEGSIDNLVEEKKFLTKRRKIVWPAIIAFLKKINLFDELYAKVTALGIDLLDNQTSEEFLTKLEPPKIALISTGGSYRTMIETIGFLTGAEKIGLLDCCSYMCGLSGSAWAMTAFVASHKNAEEFAQTQKTKVGNLTNDRSQMKGGMTTLQQLMLKVAANPQYIRRSLIQSRFNQPQGLIGFYGHAIAHALLDGFIVGSKTNHDITYSDLQSHLVNAKYPLPLCVAVESSKENTQTRQWFEFSPYYCGTYKTGIGGNSKGMHIETKYFGSIFSDGKIIQHIPEYPLAQLFGIWGSAFAVDGSNQKNRNNVNGTVRSIIDFYDKEFSLCYKYVFRHAPKGPSRRIEPGEIPSFLYSSEENATAQPEINDREKLFLSDGGITLIKSNHHSFATIPALVRNVDLLILCDCTPRPDEKKTEHLFAAAKEAGNLSLPFPKISSNNIKDIENMKVQATLISDEAPSPLVVYMQADKNQTTSYDKDFYPEQKDPQLKHIANFSYAPEKYDTIKNFTASIMQNDDVTMTIGKALQTAVIRIIEAAHKKKSHKNNKE